VRQRNGAARHQREVQVGRRIVEQQLQGLVRVTLSRPERGFA